MTMWALVGGYILLYEGILLFVIAWTVPLALRLQGAPFTIAGLPVTKTDLMFAITPFLTIAVVLLVIRLALPDLIEFKAHSRSVLRLRTGICFVLANAVVVGIDAALLRASLFVTPSSAGPIADAVADWLVRSGDAMWFWLGVLIPGPLVGHACGFDWATPKE